MKQNNQLIAVKAKSSLQNEEKQKGMAVPVIATNEFIYLQQKIVLRPAAVIITNTETALRNAEKEKLTDEFLRAKKDIALQNEKKKSQIHHPCIAYDNYLLKHEETGLPAMASGILTQKSPGKFIGREIQPASLTITIRDQKIALYHLNKLFVEDGPGKYE